MTVKDILVHITGDAAEKNTLTTAVDLAKRHDARLIGLFARKEIDPSAMVAHQPSEGLLAAAAEAHRMFEAAAAGLRTKWWQVIHGADADILGEVVFCTHYVDLMVMSQPKAYGKRLPSAFVDKVILGGGRPVLVVPTEGTPAPVGRRVVIGWRSGKEAARALHDCLPYVAGAEEILVSTVRGFMPKDETTPQVDIIDHLKAHGLAVTGERVLTEGLGVMDSLLSRCYDMDADLLAIGAHVGKALSFGGKTGAGTRHILEHMRIPVLFSC